LEYFLKSFVGVTDFEWFSYLSSRPGIDELNFWQPGGKQYFRSLNPSEPFLFKLPYPHHRIVGGGFFAHSTILPVSLA
jgi:putative restriction endonuclease